MLPLPPSSPTPAGSAAPDADAVLRARLQGAAERFEGVFIHQMLKTMRQSSQSLAGEDALFKRNTDNPLLDLADQMVADKLASQRAFGIADLLTRQLLPPVPQTVPLKADAAPAALSSQMDTRLDPTP